MKSNQALRTLSEVTASQWGMVTTAQAGALGVTRLTLSRLADAGHLERLAYGVYRDAGAPNTEFEDLRAAWLSTEPKLRAEERLHDLADGVVVASSSAAALHGVGDLWADRHEFVTAKRRQTQRAEIRYRQRRLDNRDVTLAAGLPVMTLERTLADLLDDVREMSLVADALGMAIKKQRLDFDRLRELFSPLAERNGFRRHDGDAVLERLLEIAGLGPDSIASRIMANPAISSRIFDNHKAATKISEEPNRNKPILEAQDTTALADISGALVAFSTNKLKGKIENTTGQEAKQ
ncbi:type IV toxin-antitoxin system AbiEi family antitoxin domain-containing protein [Bifidobacterium tibiigranuli]|jgi:predicted transcriptional regulator of viral defense system|uniref:type IV toxin-antitoxin system AbiEi family antitoxin domain-containing protein n=1 Tax=Bifidobacterium tibiigranuli TaxID=2172043 RepID=UPI0026EE7568|nr:type IV toxin-antitoxin system AbiEi family antitoxin domain-containing protein [Bifidobacterium tibiigranuli]MCI1650680.1 type IV toxin-antitoxin system AbiEi family antitoxin domain-containing protein [Bifidobacterium tibiigranuli]MCI1672682.1 type IV toxin-antitoxin system AbiEi family antitoxin domain-containing protein [Bifidobacterium tibiigranuli]MCI1712313.1 type IV toxin-antitoxin system AbiEi family antitoxin domain-containing protein [Bifidobacterium tibiigranuli]MCI1833311.1 type